MKSYSDIAIPISWPDKTAFGDEKWMAFLKKIKIVKNLHFKVGHAAILLIERSSGMVSYFDFGRYLCPRGYGRARSDSFDPRLTVRTKAVFDGQELVNLEEILEELQANEPATHGGGRMLFSIARDISYDEGMTYAREIVDQGPVLYGALAKNNNSCSRYVAQILAKAMRPKDKRIGRILYPECLKASPTSNVVNASFDRKSYCYHAGRLEEWQLNRWQSLKFQVSLLKDNFRTSDTGQLKSDSSPGLVAEPARPLSVPESAQWLGGIGEGAWFDICHIRNRTYEIFKFNLHGKIEYLVQTECLQQFDILQPYQFTYDLRHGFYRIMQNGEAYQFKAAARLNVEQNITQHS